MAITGIEQADILEIDKQVRLRRYDGQHDFAFEWHQDIELVWLVDGDKERYSHDLLNRMYDYLSKNGECYFIEIFEDNQFIPIGDVTLFADDFAIAIGDKRYWNQGIAADGRTSKGAWLCGNTCRRNLRLESWFTKAVWEMWL